MSDWRRDDPDEDDYQLTPEDLEMLRNLFGIQASDHDDKLDTLINELKELYGFVDKQMLIQRLMQEYGIDPEFLDQVQQDIVDLNMDHLSHLFNLELDFEIRCQTCFELKSELCEHISGEARLEMYLQQGLVEQGLAYLNQQSMPKLEVLLWRIRFLIVEHDIREIKKLLNEASQLIYDDNNTYNIFRVQVLKIHYLLDRRMYDEALKVADTISPMTDSLDMENDPSISYWMASLSQGMASALLKMGQLQIALDPLLVSTELFIKSGNQYQVAISFAILSSVMGMLQDGIKTQESARKALKLMHQLDNEFGLIRVKTFVSSGFLALFDTEIALDYATEALSSALPTEKNTIIAALYGLITQIHLVDGSYQTALEVADTCLEYANNQEIHELRSIAVALKGDIHAELNQFNQAIDFYEEAISYLEDGLDDQLILDLDRRIANLEKLK